ncbi:hypothetical protein AB2B38_002660 [Balneola sp. MJW-20]|uniref:hypothetical protein n=1 Tax=Gracilimonas aurantiaca TaxID=3234185 RepID=UPI00346563B4
MKWSESYSCSYVPYSGKAVCCAVKGTNGKVYTGSRIENISFPLTISAIQAACCICLSDGSIPEIFFIEEHNEPEQLDFWEKEFNAQIRYTDELPLTELPDYRENNDRIKSLEELLEDAVVTESDFPVSCIIKAGENNLYSGVNIEVSEWSKGLCAERIALSKAIISGAHLKTAEMSVCTLKGEFSAPCGACRQVILEHLPFNSIHMFNADGTRSSHLTVDLLPFNFKTSFLNKDSE